MGGGFLDVAAGLRDQGSGLEGFARGEAGWHFMPTGSAFAFGEADLKLGAPLTWQAGIGARVTF